MSLSILTQATAINGFECCDLWPFDSEIFLAEASVAFKLTDKREIHGEALSERESVSSEHSWTLIERQRCGPSLSEISFKKMKPLKQATLTKDSLYLKYLKY